MGNDQNQELLAIFLEEAVDLTASLSSILREWETDLNNVGKVTDLKRDLHTLKGSARMVGQAEVGSLAHEMETLSDAMAKGQIKTERSVFDQIVLGLDHISLMIEAIQKQEAPPSPEHLIQIFHQILAGEKSAGSMGGQPPGATPAAATPPPVPMTEANQELLAIFLEEAVDLTGSLSGILREWEADLNNLGKVTDLKRDLHTLKGSARMVGQAQVGALAHEMETLSDAMAKGQIKTERSVFDQIVLGLDHISLMIEAIQKHETPPSPDPLIQIFHQILAGEQPVATAAPPQTPTSGEPGTAPTSAAAATASATPQGLVAEVIRIKATLLETLNRLSTENNMMRVGFEQQVINYGEHLRELKQEMKRLEGQLNTMTAEIRTHITHEEVYGQRQSLQNVEGDVPVAAKLERFLALEQLSKVIRETALDIVNTFKGLNESHAAMETLLLNQTRVGTELQHRLSDTRLVPFESVVPRLSRIARQVSTELKKKIDFKVLKSEGEMDRTVLEHLVPSLEHILRNAIDHGIESSEERLKQGKPETGKIEITFLHKGSIAAIKIQDDGAGINSDAVRKKAIKIGLLPEKNDVSDEEVVRYILEPGFSTRESVSMVSGRGVGMDVVNTAVKEMGGSLDIVSVPGKGAEMTVRFPFTSSLNRVLLFHIHSEIYGMLLSSMEGVANATEAQVKEFLTLPSPIFQSGGKSYHFHYLAPLLDSSSKEAHSLAGNKTYPVILIPSSSYPMALLVDSVLYTRELLVQSMGAQFKLTRECSGATLLGDGRVVLILDPEALSENARNYTRQYAIEFTKTRKMTPAGRQVVMVVDDSASARAVARQLLGRNNYHVIEAKDGIDALQQLENTVPALFLMDIDMPRMDGLELASTLREDRRYQKIPIIMLTALANPQRRQQAQGLKLEGFIEKPYEETQLLLAVQALLENKK